MSQINILTISLMELLKRPSDQKDSANWTHHVNPEAHWEFEEYSGDW